MTYEDYLKRYIQIKNLRKTKSFQYIADCYDISKQRIYDIVVQGWPYPRGGDRKSDQRSKCKICNKLAAKDNLCPKHYAEKEGMI
jgi:hypothetical protein